MTSKVSIITPVKNGEKYLDEYFESIINQSHENWELIIVNDHSSDQTNSIIKKYAQTDTRIQHLQNNGQGIIDALNTAYSKATGDFITRMDADDQMPKNKLDIMLDRIPEKGAHLVVGKVKYIENEYLKSGYRQYASWLNGIIEKSSFKQELYKECVIPSCAWLMQRSVFESIGGFKNLSYPEDYDFCFRLMQHKINIIGINKVVHLWRDYPERSSRNDKNYLDNTFIQLKTIRFIELDYRKSKPLLLWGAGNKGKQIAKILNENKIPFKWVCENDKKIGLKIYGNKLHFPSINPKAQYIIAVANKEEQVKIKARLKDTTANVFWFC